MKKYSLLIILSCLGSYSFASESSNEESCAEDESVEQIQEWEVDQSSMGLTAFMQSLKICQGVLNLFDCTDIENEFQTHINGIIAYIDEIQEKVASIMPKLQDAEKESNFKTKKYLKEINFNFLLDEFIKLEDNALQWLENNQFRFEEGTYNYIERTLYGPMIVALAWQKVTSAIDAVGSTFSCCEVM
ncbi:MAG: hypothetical protein LBR92_04685 [Puniceicoccales bacterium]|jgi:hypothetical protein|nr:hypothetical protein [Puniceicoccales bacterium]